MGSAEQGGLGSQRVLLIGGPKHGEYMNLADGQAEYEFTSMERYLPVGSCDAFANWPECSTHNYKLDRTLSPFARATAGSGLTSYTTVVNIFTHEVLWGSPVQGGFNLWALTDAHDGLAKADEALKIAQADKSVALSSQRALESEIAEWQRKYDDLHKLTNDLEDRMLGIRKLLEMVGVPILAAVDLTGRDYESAFDDN